MPNDQPRRSDRLLSGVPEGLDAMVLAQLVAEAGSPGTHGTTAGAGVLVHIARDDRRLDALEQALQFFAPDVKVIPFPAWDTVPYDRVGPNAEIVARRITALSKFALAANRKEPTIVLTTINAVLQRVPPRAFIKQSLKPMAADQRVDRAKLLERLEQAGYTRS
ncbi:MAG: transcription-repair coupling factor, partial [Hyphomicrobium sp.]